MWSQLVALRRAAFRHQVRKFIICLVLVGLGATLSVQGAIAGSTPPPAAAPTGNGTGSNNGQTTWGGLGWGLGISADFDVGGQRVSNASIVNGITRVTDTSGNVGVGFVLEAHYFFRDWDVPFVTSGCSKVLPGIAYSCTDAALGPFVAIEVGGGSSATPSANGPITAYALGAMVGFRHLSVSDSGVPTTNNNTSSWNFGIGLRIDPKAQVLGGGFVANAPPPAGETTVRYQTEPRLGIMLLSSFSF
jgi:hypothetical protein